jgi:hypothetical protein
MTTTQHTPGPWEICQEWPEENQRKIQPQDSTTGLALAFGDTEEEANANARLIAAAPQMLNALHTALDAIGDTYEARDNDSQGEMIRDIIAAAIEAATGEEVPA